MVTILKSDNIIGQKSELVIGKEEDKLKVKEVKKIPLWETRTILKKSLNRRMWRGETRILF